MTAPRGKTPKGIAMGIFPIVAPGLKNLVDVHGSAECYGSAGRHVPRHRDKASGERLRREDKAG